MRFLCKCQLVIALFLLVGICVLNSCTTVKNHPKGRPFLYKTKIVLTNDVARVEKRWLKKELPRQMHDSLQLNQKTFFLAKTIINPPVFDSFRLSKSEDLVAAYLRSKGYDTPKVSSNFAIKTVGDQQRVFVNMNVDPAKRAIVYKNVVEVIDSAMSKKDKKKLELELSNYWDDSLKVRWQQQYVFFRKLLTPPMLDTSRLAMSETLMKSYLRSRGYYHPLLTSTIDTIDSKKRFKKLIATEVKMIVYPGNQTIIDSFNIDIADTMLQKLSIANPKRSQIIAGKTPFTVAAIADELERNLSYFRQNGYFRFTRDDLIAHVDTIDERMLEISTDPFEQAIIITQLEAKRKQHPTASVTIKLRSQVDSSYLNPLHTKQYFIDSVYYYPEYDGVELPDSVITQTFKNEQTEQGFIVKKDHFGSFKINPMRENTFIRHGQLYDETRYLRTLNAFNQLGAWSQVDAIARPSGEDSLNFHILLTEADPIGVVFDLEASRNTGDFLGSTNLFGVSLNSTFRSRNLGFPPGLAKKAFQYSATLRNGVELSIGDEKTFLQTLQTSLGQTLAMPRLRFPIGSRLIDSALSKLTRTYVFGRPVIRYPQQQWRRESPKTIINVNAAYTDRRDFFRLRSLTGSWGYDWKRGDNVWSVRVPNLEFYSLDTLPQLVTAFETNPFLRSAFNTGSIVGLLSFNYTQTFNHPRHTRLARMRRFAMETSGFPGSQRIASEVYQYVKFEHEQRWTISYPKSAFAFRFFGGIGFNYSNDVGIGFTLPFYKQFVAGGPNSMRAWGLRQLGLGSSLVSDTSSTFRDRFGDMQLELNMEVRRTIFSFGSFTLNGALFADIGNIWNVRETNNKLAEFNLSRLGQDIAIGTGVGLRLDFGYFLVRFDFGIKLKDPARRANGGWLSLRDFSWENNEFPGKDKRNNYAIQLGVGLPF